MEIRGKVKQILPATNGQSARGDWSKQNVIIETEGEYPKDVALLFFNKPEIISQLSVGCSATFMINVQSREYNQRWYTDVTVYGVNNVAGFTQQSHYQQATSTPQQPQPQQAPQAPMQQHESSDDMHF